MSSAFAVIVAVRADRRGIRSVLVACPYCEKRHTHGWVPDATPSRASHCGNGEYRLVVTPGDYDLEAALA